jgi:nitroimidazol reductase NimA-like FMN-containing flavoprotein (pyridoxamine 5'-phosphate oxidase superfamily)
MPSRRHLIRLTPEEQQQFLARGKTIYLASNGVDGYPHLIAMWFALEDGAVLMTTFRKSHKVRDLARDPRCALLLEEGTSYDKLKGIFLRGKCEIIDDETTTLETLAKVGARSSGIELHAIRKDLEAMRPQARKRVTLVVRPEKIGSWDHAKLEGV